MLDTIDDPAEAEVRPGWWSSKSGIEKIFVVAMVAVVLAGIGVRAYHVLSASFPLNDGGLFYQMSRDLQQSGYRLPATTTYNFARIPFAYPPLGFYATALLDDTTPFSLMTMFRVVPLLASCLTVLAFALLARRFIESRLALVVSVAAFAFVPRSFIWLLMGGGVTRALGLLFALLALHQWHSLYTTRNWRFAVSTALLAALTVLSHLETGFFLAFSGGLLWLFFGRNRFGLVASIGVGAAVLALTSPWWGAVMVDHGLAPFRDANSSGGSIWSDASSRRYVALSLARIVSTSEPYFPLIGALGVLGALSALVTRRLFLPLWWVVTIILDPRAFPTFTTVPVAMLAGIGVAEILLPGLGFRGATVGHGATTNSERGRWRRSFGSGRGNRSAGSSLSRRALRS